MLMTLLQNQNKSHLQNSCLDFPLKLVSTNIAQNSPKLIAQYNPFIAIQIIHFAWQVLEMSLEILRSLVVMKTFPNSLLAKCSVLLSIPLLFEVLRLETQYSNSFNMTQTLWTGLHFYTWNKSNLSLLLWKSTNIKEKLLPVPRGFEELPRFFPLYIPKQGSFCLFKIKNSFMLGSLQWNHCRLNLSINYKQLNIL